MSDLHIVFDGWHLQNAYTDITDQPLYFDRLRCIRNKLIKVARTDGRHFTNIRTDFISGGDSEVIPYEKRRKIQADLTTLQEKKHTSASMIHCDISFYLLPMTWINRLKQPPECDELIADLIRKTNAGVLMYVGNDAALSKDASHEIPEALRHYNEKRINANLINVQIKGRTNRIHTHYSDIAEICHMKLASDGTLTH
jgi:hypothetical protein